MQRFILRRLVFSVVAVLLATLVLFGLSHLSTDPRQLYVPEGGYGMTDEHWDMLGERMGFDKPFFVQYFLWLGRMIRGDFGTSLGQMKQFREEGQALFRRWR